MIDKPDPKAEDSYSEEETTGARRPAMVLFAFPEDARWSDERCAVEFTVVLGEYQGTVRVHRRAFQRMLDQSPTPERCLEAFHSSGRASSLRSNGSCDGDS